MIIYTIHTQNGWQNKKSQLFWKWKSPQKFDIKKFLHIIKYINFIYLINDKMTTLEKESQIESTNVTSSAEELHDLMKEVKSNSEQKEVKEISELWKRFESMFNTLVADHGYDNKGDFWRVQKFDEVEFDLSALWNVPFALVNVPCIEIFWESHSMKVSELSDKKMRLWYDKVKDQFYYCPDAGKLSNVRKRIPAFSYALKPDEAKKYLDEFEKYIWEIKSMEDLPK